SDSVTNFGLHNATSTLHSSVTTLYEESGSTGTATGPGEENGAVQGYSGRTLKHGANMSLSGNFDARDSGTVINLNGNALSANTIYLGWFDGQAVTLSRGGAGGTLAATTLDVGNNTFDLRSTDSVTNFGLHNATSTLHSSVVILYEENGST